MKNRFLLLLMAVLFISSCSDNKKNGLLELIPADNDVVMVSDFKTIMESAGGSLEGSKISLPSTIQDLLPHQLCSSIDDTNDFLKNSGIDIEACAMVVNYDAKNPIYIFNLTDRKKFVKTIEDEGFREDSDKDGLVVYSKKTYDGWEPEWDEFGYFAVGDNYAYWIQSVSRRSDMEPVKDLYRFAEKAKDDNFASTTSGKYIMQGNAGGAAFAWPKEAKRELRRSEVPSEFLSIFDGHLCMYANLTENKMEIVSTVFDENGKELDIAKLYKDYFDTSATINAKALQLLGKDEYVIYAISLKNVNWDKMADIVANQARLSRSDRAQMDAVMSYLQKIDGTIAMGFGFNNGFKSIANLGQEKNMLEQFSATMVIETKEGKTKQIIENMKGFLESGGISFVENETGFTISDIDRSFPGTIYVKAVDNFIAIANHPIKPTNDNHLVNNSDISNHSVAIYAELDKNNAFAREMNIDNSIKMAIGCKPSSINLSITFEIDGNDGTGFLTKVFNVASKVMTNSKDIMEDYFGSSYDYSDYDYDDDYVTCDSVAVDSAIADTVVAYDYDYDYNY